MARHRVGPVEFEVTWGGDPEDVLIVTSGVANVEGLRAMSDAVLLDYRYQPTMLALLDHSLLDWTYMTSGAIRRRADDLADMVARIGSGCVAVVVRTPDFGLLRMLQSISNRPRQRCDDARTWLREPPRLRRAETQPGQLPRREV